MLIVQPTPFCNINCDYCYLSNRQSTKKMAKEKAVEILDRLVSANDGRESEHRVACR